MTQGPLGGRIDFRSCEVQSCSRRPTIAGRCTHHQPTSDGRTTGSTFKLTDEDVSEARRMLSRFVSKKDIAAHFGVDRVTLNKALRRPRPAPS